MEKDRWPNLFIVGAPRAGTTSLYRYLDEIPQIFISPQKEPNFFNSNSVSDDGTIFIRPIRDKPSYLKLFENASDEIYLCEATTHYLFDTECTKQIHNFSPAAKIIISLRDPVEREYSQYKLFFHRAILEKINYHDSFFEEIKKQMKDKNSSWEPGLRLESGLYTQNIKKYIDIFGKENVKILIFENWINDPKTMMIEILQFLKINYDLENFRGIAHHKSSTWRIPKNNISRNILNTGYKSKIINKIIPKSISYYVRDKFFTRKIVFPELDNQSRKILINFYCEDVKNLENLLGCKLPWPNFRTD